MFGIGTWEIVLIMALALIVLGPNKLPELAKTLGKGLASLRKSADDVKREINLEGIRKEIEEDVGIDELKRMVDVRGEIRKTLAEMDEPEKPENLENNPQSVEEDKKKP